MATPGQVLSHKIWKELHEQGFIQDFWLGVGNFFGKTNVRVGGCGGILSGAHYHWTHHARGGLVASPPGNFLKFRPSEITSGAFSFP